MIKTYNLNIVLLVLLFIFSFGFSPQISHAQSYTCTDISVSLKQGSRGSSVASLQRFLINKGFLAGTADGSFGFKTRLAVIAYQRSVGITPLSGVVGPITRAAIKSSESCGVTQVTQPINTSTPYSQSSNNSQAYQTVKNDFNRIGFSIPSNWVVVSNGISGTLVLTDVSSKPAMLMLMPISQVSGQYAGRNINIKEMFQSANSTFSLSSLENDIMTRVRQSTTTRDWIVKESLVEGFLGNKPVFMSTVGFTTVGPSGDEKGTQRHYIFLNNDILYMVAMTTSEADYNSYIPTFDYIKQSFTFY